MKLILYYAMTNYQLLSLIIFKIKYKNNNDSIIYISEWLEHNQPQTFENLKKSKIFSDVRIFKEYIWPRQYNAQILDEVIKNAEIQLKDIINICNEIFVGADHQSFGIYLIKKKFKYNYFEESNGVLNDKSLLFNCIKKENIVRYNIVNKLKISGESENVINRYGDLTNAKKHNNKDINFRIRYELSNLKKDELAKILYIFGAKPFYIKEKQKNLLLTWHYCNMKYLSLDEEHLFFSLLADYFSAPNEKLVIKPHPSDVQGEYDKWFKDAIILNRFIPSELIPHCFTGKFKNGITNWSTSVNSLGDIINKIINFDTRIDNTFKEMDLYYVVAEFLKVIKCKTKIYLYNINEILLKRLLDTYFPNYEKYYELIIIDELQFVNNDAIYIINYHENIDYKHYKVININQLNKHFNNNMYIQIEKSNSIQEFIELNNIVLQKNKINIYKKLKYSNYSFRAYIINGDEYFSNILKRIDILSDEKNKLQLINDFLNKKIEDNVIALKNKDIIIQSLQDENKNLKLEKINLENEICICKKQRDDLSLLNNSILNSKRWKLFTKYDYIMEKLRFKHKK